MVNKSTPTFVVKVYHKVTPSNINVVFLKNQIVHFAL